MRPLMNKSYYYNIPREQWLFGFHFEEYESFQEQRIHRMIFYFAGRGKMKFFYLFNFPYAVAREYMRARLVIKKFLIPFV